MLVIWVYFSYHARMYIRVKTTPNSPRKSVQIVASIRDGNKVKQRIVRYVGIAMDERELESLKDLAEHIKIKLETEHQLTIFPPEEMATMAIEARKQKLIKADDKPLLVNLKQFEEEQRSIIGIHEIYGNLYDELGFDKILPNSKRHLAESRLLKHIVLARIANPISKRASVTMLEEEFGVHLNLDRVYRMMDKLDESTIDRAQDISYYATKQLLGGKINVIFYDATTLYFESFIEDELKQNGYSKDMKFNQSQVLLALFVTEQGLPIGYSVFPGASYEGHTLLPILKDLKRKYEINKVIFVADSGMLNEDNLALLEEEGFDYIVGARIRNMDKEITKKILNRNNYSGDSDNCVADFMPEANNRRLIINYNAKRAEKDCYDRETAIERLRSKIQKSQDPKTLISNYGYKKYLEIEGTATVKVNQDKLSVDSEWDGLHGIITNIKNMSAEELLSYYKGLWQVEESFRITKHDLKVRPIFHWTPKRIQAHLCIAFIAFSCIRHLEYRVKLQYKKISPEEIRRELIHIQVSILKDIKTQKRYCIPSKISLEAKKIYQVMGMKHSTIPFQLEKPSKHQSNEANI
jgi:transposase